MKEYIEAMLTCLFGHLNNNFFRDAQELLQMLLTFLLKAMPQIMSMQTVLKVKLSFLSSKDKAHFPYVINGSVNCENTAKL